MAILPYSNYNAYMDSSRPFTHIFTVNTPNCIGLVYVLQKENPATNAWETVTEPLVQPLEWGYSNEFRIDPSQICTDYVRFNPAQNLGTSNFEKMDDHVTHWRYKYTEQTVDPNTNEVSFESNQSLWQTSPNKFYAIDMAITHEETYKKAQHQFCNPYHLYSHNWSGGSLGTAKFLSDRPQTTEICSEDNNIMSWATRLKDTYLCADIYREDGTVHDNVRISNNMSDGVFQLGVGVPQIKDYFTNLGTLSTYWTTSNQWTKIVISVKYDGLDNVSQQYTMNIKDCGCTNEHVRLWWRNSRNGMDCYTFKGTHKTSISQLFERFQQPLGQRRHQHEDTTKINYQRHNTFNQQSFGKTKVNIRSNKKMSVFSGWNGGEHLEWLSQIMTSTHVWIEDRSVSTSQEWKLTPVIVTTGQMDTKPLNSSLGKLKLDLEYANPRTTNRI